MKRWTTETNGKFNERERELRKRELAVKNRELRLQGIAEERESRDTETETIEQTEHFMPSSE